MSISIRKLYSRYASSYTRPQRDLYNYDPYARVISFEANTDVYFRRRMTAHNTNVDIALDGSLYLLFADGAISDNDIQKHDTKFAIGQYDFTCRKFLQFAH